MSKQLRIRRVSQKKKKKKEYEGTLQLFFFSSHSSPCFCSRLVVHQNQLFHKIIVNGNMEDSNKVVKTQVSINFLLLSKSNRCSKMAQHFYVPFPGHSSRCTNFQQVNIFGKLAKSQVFLKQAKRQVTNKASSNLTVTYYQPQQHVKLTLSLPRAQWKMHRLYTTSC